MLWVWNSSISNLHIFLAPHFDGRVLNVSLAEISKGSHSDSSPFLVIPVPKPPTTNFEPFSLVSLLYIRSESMLVSLCLFLKSHAFFTAACLSKTMILIISEWRRLWTDSPLRSSVSLGWSHHDYWGFRSFLLRVNREINLLGIWYCLQLVFPSMNLIQSLYSIADKSLFVFLQNWWRNFASAVQFDL